MGFSEDKIFALQKGISKNPTFVIPAKAGIQFFPGVMDPDFRRDDVSRGAQKGLQQKERELSLLK